MKIDIYTDGACSGNPGAGGYAFIILKNDKELIKSSGCLAKTTNNYMELKAIVRSLEHVSEMIYYRNIEEIVIHSDSAYCINPVEKGWLKFWKKNNWMTKQNEPIKNLDLWKKLDTFVESKKFNIKFKKVKGHSGNKYNEMVDRAAKRAILRLNELETLPSKEAQR